MRPTFRLAVVLFAFIFALPLLHAQQLPQFEIDPAWPKVPAKWKLGDVSSVAVDAQDHVWVLHRPRTLKGKDLSMAAPPVIIFDTAGNFIRAWGGDGPGYEWPQREHGIHIDSKGFIWIGGNNCAPRNLPNLKHVYDDQYLKFTPDGKFVLQIGHSNQSKGNADTNNLQMPADARYYAKTNEVFIADGYGNHRVIVFDADTGRFKRMWGAFGNKPEDHLQCPPWDVKPSDDAPQFSIVHSIRISNDGMVYAGDREYQRVQVFDVNGKYLKQKGYADAASFAGAMAFSPDPQQRFLYVGGGDRIYVLDRKSLSVLGSVKPDGLRSGGHQMATDSKGNLYVAQTGKGIQKLTYKGMSR